MIKLTFCLHRLPSLSRKEFSDYWFEHHAPLVTSHREALKIAKYVQLHGSADPIDDALRESREAPERYDGVAQLWWHSLEDIHVATASDEGREAGRALLEDERKFIDLKRSPLFVGVEREIF